MCAYIDRSIDRYRHLCVDIVINIIYEHLYFRQTYGGPLCTCW